MSFNSVINSNKNTLNQLTQLKIYKTIIDMKIKQVELHQKLKSKKLAPIEKTN